MINTAYRKIKSPITRHYVDNQLFTKEVQKSIDNSRSATEELGKMLLLMIDHMLNSYKFVGYSEEWKAEMKDFAIYKAMRAIRTCDPTKAKDVFNYFSRTIYLAFLTQLGKLKKQANYQKSRQQPQLKAKYTFQV